MALLIRPDARSSQQRNENASIPSTAPPVFSTAHLLGYHNGGDKRVPLMQPRAQPQQPHAKERDGHQDKVNSATPSENKSGRGRTVSAIASARLCQQVTCNSTATGYALRGLLGGETETKHHTAAKAHHQAREHVHQRAGDNRGGHHGDCG